MQNKKTVGLIVGFIIVALVSFYTGTKFPSTKKITNISGVNQFNQGDQFGKNKGMRGGLNNGMVGGEILSKDAQSFVVKMRDGGSKIVFYTDKTTVSKSVDGTLSDLIIGKDVNIIGTPNPDGSLNAQSVSLRTIPSVIPKN